MPKLISWDLLTVRNVVVIAGIALAWHFMLAPVFKSMGGGSKSDE